MILHIKKSLKAKNRKITRNESLIFSKNGFICVYINDSLQRGLNALALRGLLWVNIVHFILVENRHHFVSETL